MTNERQVLQRSGSCFKPLNPSNALPWEPQRQMPATGNPSSALAPQRTASQGQMTALASYL
jgi:hypothetical protein